MFTGPNVRVDDGLLSPELRQRLIDCVSWMPLYFLNRFERFKSHELDTLWYYPLAFTDEGYTADVEPALYDLDASLAPVRECWEQLKTAFGRPVRLYECMLSANAFGNEGRVHQDITDEARREKHYTALVYLNREWKAEWAGETVFFDADNEISGAVLPRPGRVVIAARDAPHAGRSVSRICPTDRRVLVFKFWDVS